MDPCLLFPVGVCLSFEVGGFLTFVAIFRWVLVPDPFFVAFFLVCGGLLVVVFACWFWSASYLAGCLASFLVIGVVVAFVGAVLSVGGCFTVSIGCSLFGLG